MSSKIIIMGMGPGWEKAPLEGEIWGFNDCLLLRPVNLVFDMHNLSEVLLGREKLARRSVEDVKAGLAKIKETKTPMYSLECWPGLGCKRFPIEEVIHWFKLDYFTCGVAYAISWALYNGARQLDLYGISLTMANEYHSQKPCIETWLGFAMGRGVEVNICTESELFKSPNRQLYGYNIKQERLKNPPKEN